MAPRKRTATIPKELPSAEMDSKEIPSTLIPNRPLPMVGVAENTVFIGGKPIEIKPTKLKYQRNRTAAFYRMIDMYPLMDIMAMEAGVFGDDRDGDKAIMDWLIAVTDDEQLIVENYDSMDTETIEKILMIFKRVNRIDEKDEKLKKHGTGSEEGISLDKAVPIVAVHLGVIDEDMINNMSYIFFEDVLEQLGHKQIYDAVVNYAGNSFCEKSWDMISDNNPLSVAADGKVNRAMDTLVNMFNSADVRIINKDEGEHHEV